MKSKPSTIIHEARRFSEEILQNKLPEILCYHCIEHTHEVVKAAKMIGEGMGLHPDQLEVVELAAWFHDLGYCEVVENHEEVSANIALSFLESQDFSNERSAQVVGCIMATKMPQSPKNEMEAVLCDADLAHLGTAQYIQKSELLKKEIELLNGKTISEKDWLIGNVDFISNHKYFTNVAKGKLKPIKERHLKEVEARIEAIMSDEKEIEKLEKKVEKFKKKAKKAKELKPTRGIETMFRLTSKNHIELSAMADTKANIMISVNSIILSVIVSVLVRKLEEYPHMIIPTIIMTVVCLATIVFAILATRPNVSTGLFTDEDINTKKTNLLFFGNFHRMKQDKYEWGMKEMMKDADYLYTSLIRDIYFLGVVLGRKYKLLRISYTIFMFGFVLAVISFMLAEAFMKEPMPY